jgi:WD40 repeat protein
VRRHRAALAFSPDGTMLASAGIGGSARLWDVATRRQIGAAIRVSRVWVLGVD